MATDLAAYRSTYRASWQRLVARAQSVPPLVVDAAIALACFLTPLAYCFAVGILDGLVVALALGASLPLLWRRRYPFTVTAVAGVFTTWLAIIQALGQLPAAQLVATYTFAVLSPPLHRLVLVLGTAAGLGLSLAIPREEILTAAPAIVMFVVAYAMGTGFRARRDRIAMLEERARRLAEERQAAATRERERIAREMHDILAHAISLVVVQAEAGPVMLRHHPERAEAAFDTISATAREALMQLRRALGVLRPDAGGPASGQAGGQAAGLTGTPLDGATSSRAPQPDLAALPALVAGAELAGLTAVVEERGQPRPVPDDLAATVYRIVQEALTNTVRHAAASQVRVRVEWRERALYVEVRDDGRGHTAGSDEQTGHGLLGMRERVSVVGGTLTTGPAPDGTGFQVSATLPVG